MIRHKNKKLILAYFSFSIVISSIILYSYGINRFSPKDSKCTHDVAREGVVFIAQVKAQSSHDIKILTENCFDISGIAGNIVTIYAAKYELKKLRALGFETEIIDKQPNDNWREETKDHELNLSYHSYESLTQELHDFANKYQDITRLVSIGKSVQKRDIWAIKITDNPDFKEDEPSFKYIASIHGDEPVGTQLLMNFIKYLCDEYPSNYRIQKLIDETEIWILPLMNPDGFERGRRYNASGYDLNRNFPIFPKENKNLQPETRHVIDWSLENNFTLSANFHGGALVANYPFDYDGSAYYSGYAATPDDALFRVISKRYSFHNKPMWNNYLFPEGITNGADWYVIRGSMQDWNYKHTGNKEITLEVSQLKNPPASSLPQYWEDNRESMISYIESVHMGVRGIALDKESGEPLFVKVEVDGIDHPVYSNKTTGNYHRLLLPGKYNFKFTSEGFVPLTINNVLVFDGEASKLDVELYPK